MTRAEVGIYRSSGSVLKRKRPEPSLGMTTVPPACRSRALVATFDLMTRRNPLVRLVGLLTVAAFLLGQSWMICAPLCLLQGHARVALGASQYQGHVMHCHSDNAVLSQLPTAQSLGNMLPARVAPPLLPSRVMAVRFAPPAPIHLQQIPPADPPPPRAV